MDTSAWQVSKQKYLGNVYTPRRPTETALYQLVYEYRTEFEYRWDDLFQHKYGILRKAVLDAFDAYLNCGTFAHGCARICCDYCNHSELLAFSCKRRGLCPSCDVKRAHIFAEHTHQNILLAYPHNHTVWTIPKRLRPFFKFNRKLNKLLYQAAWNAWNDYVQLMFPFGKTGAVMSLHTAGDLLAFHPHLHSINLSGVIDEHGVFQSLPEIDTELLQKQFSYLLLTYLLKQELITDDTVNSMNNWEHSGFSVYAGEPIDPDNNNARLFVARYLQKCPISLKRLAIVDNGLLPTVRYKKILDDGEEYRDFSPLEFLAELQEHIPDMWEQTTRYYGMYSARTRGAKNREILVLKSIPAPYSFINEPEEPKRPVSRTWAAWIKKVYEVDPLICPKCGSDMRIKAFIFDPREIARISKHLGAQWRAPPSIGSNNSEPYIEYLN